MSQLDAALEPLFYYWKAARRSGEGFGDFTARVGFEALRRYSEGYVAQGAADALPKVGGGLVFVLGGRGLMGVGMWGGEGRRPWWRQVGKRLLFLGLVWSSSRRFQPANPRSTIQQTPHT